MNNRGNSNYNGRLNGTSDTIINRINSTKVKINETSINSAAFQDHIMNSFNLGGIDPFRQKPRLPKRPSYLSKSKKKPPTGTKRSLANAGMNIMRTESANSSVSIPKTRTGLSKKYGSSSRPKLLHEESKVATNGGVYRTKNLLEKLNTETYIDIEKKREDYVNKLSLAQRRGLVERPPMPLSLKEWKGIETKGAIRSENNDSCSICLEKFKIEAQTILSCSHIFHTNCLHSFEKYSRHKMCPLCRSKDYDKKEYVAGQKKFLINCLIKIQSLVKGFLQRLNFYANMKETGYKPANETLNRNFIAYKLGRISKKQIDHMKKERLGVEAYMKHMKLDTKSAEALIEEFLPNVEKIFRDRAQAISNLKIKLEEKSQTKLTYRWQRAYDKASKRADCECAICYSNFNTDKPTYLLSCSHIFHQACLDNFERFDMSMRQACPLCRVGYEKLLIKLKTE
ncbi:unnamed protein product [Moneuplotes crassus]|uniref:RING-type domain-containing protein n=1 Tax=Euplotes crassus TaxID=5936 RepID=A0AAD1UIZ3_EUPCR|nr:unnamed protein product [Moneuplotes crassus]